MAYSFEQIFAADPSSPGNVASNGVVTIFTPGDTTKKPLPLTTVDGLTLNNPIEVNEQGFGPAFIAPIDRVAWEGAGYTGFLTSYDGMKEEAVAARTAANAAQVAAEDAARNTAAPTAEVVAEALAAEGPARTALEQAVTAGTANLALKPDNGGKPVGKGELVINVRDFGAKGDGKTNDQAAIQAAVDSISATGGTIYFPPGEYVARAAVVLASNIHITGSHAAVLRKTVDQTDYCYFVARSGNRLGYGGGVHGITITNLVFRGDLAAGRSLCAITAHRLSGLYINNCKFLETSQNGHVIDLLGCEDVVIENSEFRGVKPVAGRGYVEAVQVDSSIRTAAGWADTHSVGEVFDGTPTRNVTVRRCTFGGITVNGVRYGSQSPIGSHAYVEGKAYTGIRFQENRVSEVITSLADNYSGIIHFTGARDVQVTGNTFDCNNIPNTVVRMYSGATAFRVTDVNATDASTITPPAYTTPDDIVVANNIILNGAGERLLWAYGAEGQYRGKVTFQGNKFKNCLAGDSSKPLMEATRLRLAVFQGNEAVGSGGGAAVAAGNTVDIQVLDNTVDGTGGRLADVYSADRVTVSRNTALGLAAEAVKSSGVAETVIAENTLSVVAGVSCLQLVSPSSPRSVRVSRNNLSSTVPVTTAQAITIASGYTKGIVGENQSTNYAAVLSSVASGVITPNNLTV